MQTIPFAVGRVFYNCNVNSSLTYIYFIYHKLPLPFHYFMVSYPNMANKEHDLLSVQEVVTRFI